MVISCIEVSDVLGKERKNSTCGMLAFDCVWAKSLHLCLTLRNPMDCSLPGFSVHGIFQARILEWVAISKLWKIQEEMGIPYHITCLLRNLYAGQEATVRTRHETVDWFKIGKVVHQGCILSPCLFNINAESVSQFSRSVVSDSLRPHGLQHTRLPCPSPTPGFTQSHVHQVGDAIQRSHPLPSPSPLAPNPSQHQSLFQWVNSLHEVAKVLEFQL